MAGKLSKAAASLLVAAALTTACASIVAPQAPSATPSVDMHPGSASPSGEVYLPTYRPMKILPVALMGGRLVLDGGCLWVENAEGRALALWPADSRVERASDRLVVVNSGGARAEVGTTVVGGGGEYGPEHYDFVVELTGEQIPTVCRGDGHYWLVYNVHTADE